MVKTTYIPILLSLITACRVPIEKPGAKANQFRDYVKTGEITPSSDAANTTRSGESPEIDPPFKLPKLIIPNINDVSELEIITYNDFRLEAYASHPTIKATMIA